MLLVTLSLSSFVFLLFITIFDGITYYACHFGVLRGGRIEYRQYCIFEMHVVRKAWKASVWRGKKQKKIGTHSTRTSHVVTYHSTIRARTCLSSESGRDPEFSRGCGRGYSCRNVVVYEGQNRWLLRSSAAMSHTTRRAFFFFLKKTSGFVRKQN